MCKIRSTIPLSSFAFDIYAALTLLYICSCLFILRCLLLRKKNLSFSSSSSLNIEETLLVYLAAG